MGRQRDGPRPRPTRPLPFRGSSQPPNPEPLAPGPGHPLLDVPADRAPQATLPLILDHHTCPPSPSALVAFGAPRGQHHNHLSRLFTHRSLDHPSAILRCHKWASLAGFNLHAKCSCSWNILRFKLCFSITSSGELPLPSSRALPPELPSS